MSITPGGPYNLASNKTNNTAESNDHPGHHNDLADSINDLDTRIGDTLDAASALVDAGDAATLDAAEAYTDAEVDTTVYSGTTHTFNDSDVGNTIVETTNNGGAVTLTIPTNASHAFPIGTVIDIARIGSSTVTFSFSGVTLQSAGGATTIPSQYGVAMLRKRDTDTWHLVVS